MFKRNCEKKGHMERVKRRDVFLMPSKNGYRAIADSAEQTRTVCHGWGCDWKTDWVTDDSTRSSIHSLSMPSNRMRRLEHDGVVPA